MGAMFAVTSKPKSLAAIFGGGGLTSSTVNSRGAKWLPQNSTKGKGRQQISKDKARHNGKRTPTKNSPWRFQKQPSSSTKGAGAGGAGSKALSFLFGAKVSWKNF